ncbi:MFS transporter, partial [Methanoculleus chikugoensis]|uniref:MFS transporter n=1 Tax=Methanoculleus chikugoensis TaxID=118126 RepID=UPI001FB2EB03
MGGLVALGLVANLCLGSIYSWSVFVAPLAAHFTATLGREVTAAEVLLPFSVFLAFFAIAMPLAGKYIERYGPRRVTIVGGLLTGLGWLLASTATSVEALYIVYGVIGGLGGRDRLRGRRSPLLPGGSRTGGGSRSGLPSSGSGSR